MTIYQQDLLGFYNEMTKFSDEYPIRVKWEIDYRCLRFSQGNRIVNFHVLNSYCLRLHNIKETFLLSDDFNDMMSDLKSVIESGTLLEDRVLISPQKYGFKIYKPTQMVDLGPLEVCEIKVITSNSWLFRKLALRKFKLI